MDELEKQFQNDIDTLGPLLRFYDNVKQAKEFELFGEHYRINNSTNTNKEIE